MSFTLSDKQVELAMAWADEHYKTCKYRPDSFGSLLSYSFMPSGVGDSAHVHCPCGAKEYVPDPDFEF